MSKIQIEITSTAVDTDRIPYIDKKTGAAKTFDKHVQVAYLHTGAQYPQPFELQIPEADKPYPVGFYSIDANSLIIGRYKNLVLPSDFTLVPDAPAKTKISAA